MWKQVEQAVEDLRPLIHSVGIDAHVVDVLDREVTLELVRTDADASPDLARLRDFVAREIEAEVKGVSAVTFEGELAPAPAAPGPPGLKLTVQAPPPEAETVVIAVDQPVAPAATTVFDSLADASDWPAVRAALALDGVASVIGRADKLIVGRTSDAAWDALLPALEAAIVDAGAGESAAPDGIRGRVEALLDERVNPAVAAHGGVIELLDVKGTELFIHMGGGCQGCAQSQATLRNGVERMIRDAVPEVTAIYDTTDHAAGTNPYYRAG